MYRDLHQDTELRESESALQEFYDTHSISSIGILTNIEEYLSDGLLDEAETSLGGFTPTTTIESNYKNFYELYLAWLDQDNLNSYQRNSLADLAQACPFTDGPIVYNARVLHNLVTGLIVNYNDNECEMVSGERKAYNSRIEETPGMELLDKTYQLFPNPAVDELFISSSVEDEFLTITIKDPSNRILMKQSVKAKSYLALLKLNLPNGIYFVTLINKDNVQLTKKLVISK